MTFELKDLGNKIYQEDSAPLVKRIEYAWDVLQTYTVSPASRLKAYNFLLYAYDLDDTNPTEMNEKILKKMAEFISEQKRYKYSNPEYIVGKTPKSLNLSPEQLLMTHQYSNLTSQQKEKALSRKALTSQQSTLTNDQSQPLLRVNERSKELDVNTKALFLNQQDRAQHRVNIYRGQFLKNGEPFSTKDYTSHDKEGFGAFTLNTNGELSVFNHLNMTDKIAHSSMNAGAPVIAAGEIKIENGKLLALTTHSGHYQPSLMTLYRLLDHFSENNIDLSEAKILTTKKPSIKTSRLNTVVSKHSDFFETPAREIYETLKQVLEENISDMDKELQNYQKQGLFTSLFTLKDSLIKKDPEQTETLTQGRTRLAGECKKILTEFKKQLNEKKWTPSQYHEKIDALQKQLDKIKQENNLLSQKHNKKENSGRLANKVSSFKTRLSEMKEQDKTLQTNLRFTH